MKKNALTISIGTNVALKVSRKKISREETFASWKNRNMNLITFANLPNREISQERIFYELGFLSSLVTTQTLLDSSESSIPTFRSSKVKRLVAKPDQIAFHCILSRRTTKQRERNISTR